MAISTRERGRVPWQRETVFYWYWGLPVWQGEERYHGSAKQFFIDVGDCLCGKRWLLRLPPPSGMRLRGRGFRRRELRMSGRGLLQLSSSSLWLSRGLLWCPSRGGLRHACGRAVSTTATHSQCAVGAPSGLWLSSQLWLPNVCWGVARRPQSHSCRRCSSQWLSGRNARATSESSPQAAVERQPAVHRRGTDRLLKSKQTFRVGRCLLGQLLQREAAELGQTRGGVW